MAPVGSYESLVAAVAAGANSVYFGIGALNMRAASAANFGADDMAEIVESVVAFAAGASFIISPTT